MTNFNSIINTKILSNMFQNIEFLKAFYIYALMW
jgi:hypothetical protein